VSAFKARQRWLHYFDVQPGGATADVQQRIAEKRPIGDMPGGRAVYDGKTVLKALLRVFDKSRERIKRWIIEAWEKKNTPGSQFVGGDNVEGNRAHPEMEMKAPAEIERY
jgi:hypothetical protein